VTREPAKSYLRAGEDLRFDSKAGAVLGMAGLLRPRGVIGAVGPAIPEIEEEQKKRSAAREACL